MMLLLFLTPLLAFADKSGEDSHCLARCERLFERSMNRVGIQAEGIRDLLQNTPKSEESKSVCWKFADFDDCSRKCGNHNSRDSRIFSERDFIRRKCKRITFNSAYVRHFFCVHRFHTFMEVRCSSFAQEATKFRLLSKQAKKNQTSDSKQVGRDVLIQETCRYLHYHSMCLANAVFNFCPQANELFNRFTLRDYFLSFVIPEKDQLFTDRFLDYCQLYDFQKMAKDLFESTKSTTKRHTIKSTQSESYVTQPMNTPPKADWSRDVTKKPRKIFSSDEDLMDTPPNFHYSSAKYSKRYQNAREKDLYLTTLKDIQNDVDDFDLITRPVQLDFTLENGIKESPKDDQIKTNEDTQNSGIYSNGKSKPSEVVNQENKNQQTPYEKYINNRKQSLSNKVDGEKETSLDGTRKNEDILDSDSVKTILIEDEGLSIDNRKDGEKSSSVWSSINGNNLEGESQQTLIDTDSERNTVTDSKGNYIKDNGKNYVTDFEGNTVTDSEGKSATDSEGITITDFEGVPVTHSEGNVFTQVTHPDIDPTRITVNGFTSSYTDGELNSGVKYTQEKGDKATSKNKNEDNKDRVKGQQKFDDKKGSDDDGDFEDEISFPDTSTVTIDEEGKIGTSFNKDVLERFNKNRNPKEKEENEDSEEINVNNNINEDNALSGEIKPGHNLIFPKGQLPTVITEHDDYDYDNENHPMLGFGKVHITKIRKLDEEIEGDKDEFEVVKNKNGGNYFEYEDTSSSPNVGDVIRNMVTTAFNPTARNSIPEDHLEKSNTVILLMVAYTVFFFAALTILVSLVIAMVVRRKRQMYQTYIIKKPPKF